MVNPNVYTSDRITPPGFLEQLQVMPGTLDCRWNACAQRFDILELDRTGRWQLVMVVPDRRNPDGREIRKLELANTRRHRSFDDWFEKTVTGPNRRAEKSEDRKLDNLAEDIVHDKLDLIRDMPKRGFDKKYAAGLKEIANG